MANLTALQLVAHNVVRRANTIYAQATGLGDADQAQVDVISAELGQALALLDDDSDQLAALAG